MSYIKKIIISSVFAITLSAQNVFAATAHLDDGTVAKEPSFFDQIDSSMVMANWYKIILVGVAILCVIGIIISNVVWLIKKNKKNKK